LSTNAPWQVLRAAARRAKRQGPTFLFVFHRLSNIPLSR
jgi:hypothetical protein